MADSKYLGGYVSPTAHRAWHLFGRAHGVTVTGLLEALGPVLDELDEPTEGLPDLVRRAVVEARRIDGERRRRSAP